MRLIAVVLRALQLLFAIVVFGLSVDLTKEFCYYDACNSPNSKTTGFTSFAGGFGIIVSIVGFLALFWDRISSIITLVLDTLAALFFLAGGIAIAGQYKHFKQVDKEYNFPSDAEDFLHRLITQDGADCAFCFISCIVCLALVGYGFIKRKENHSSIV